MTQFQVQSKQKVVRHVLAIKDRYKIDKSVNMSLNQTDAVIRFYVETDEVWRNFLIAVIAMVETIKSDNSTQLDSINNTRREITKAILLGEITNKRQIVEMFSQSYEWCSDVAEKHEADIKASPYFYPYGVKYIEIILGKDDYMLIDSSNLTFNDYLQVTAHTEATRLSLKSLNQLVQENGNVKPPSEQSEELKLEETTPDKKSDEAIEPSEQIELNQNFLDEISQTLKIKGKKILKSSCVVQLFPEDGALMQQMSVRSDLSVGAILEPDKDDYRNVWLLILVTSSYGSSAKPVADLSIIQEYLEEFIICCKACFKAYEERSSAYTLFNCASANSYISNNFYQAYMALQTQWNVECRGVSQNYRECVVDVLEYYSIPVKEKVVRDCIPYYSKGLEYFTQGDFNSAIDCFTDAIKCNDNYAPAYFYRARSYARKKKCDCAIEDMMRALRIAEHDSSAFITVEDLHLADVYFDLGLLYSEIKELEKAARYFQVAQPLLERLSVSSSKRKSDYQKLEMLIMSNYARIQNENRKGFNWIGGIGCGFIVYLFSFGIMFFIGVLIVGAGYSWFWCWLLCGIVVFGFIRDLLEHCNILKTNIKN